MSKSAVSTMREPFVGVVVAARGEPVPSILRTVRSVLDQDWPHDRLALVVSDDGADPELRDALARLPVVYHVPPRGSAPAGSALELLRERFPHMVYVELRGAGDELAARRLIRRCVEQLERDPWSSFAEAEGDRGVVWRDEALEQLGDFPALSLVTA